MTLRFAIFIGVATLILSAASFYLGRRFIGVSGLGTQHQKIVWLAAILFVCLQIAAPFLYRTLPSRTNWIFVLQWVSYTSMGLFVSLFLYTLVSDAFLGLWSLVMRRELAWGSQVFYGVVALAFGSVAIGAVQALTGPSVRNVRISIAGLPAQLRGFRIIQVSDLHIGPILDHRYAEKVRDIVNGLGADAVVLTGDFVDGEPENYGAELASMGELKARHGVYYITGNHEYYWNAPGWIEVFRRLGAQVLINEHRVINVGGARLLIAGVPDQSAGGFIPEHAPNPARALLAPTGEKVAADLRVLLAHQPASAKLSGVEDYDVLLSGHTHGGQFFPWSLLVAATQKYYRGLYRQGKTQIYVSRGTGFWGPPIRFLIPSEVTVIELTGEGA